MKNNATFFIIVMVFLLCGGIVFWVTRKSEPIPEHAGSEINKPHVAAPVAPQPQPPALGPVNNSPKKYSSIPFKERHAILAEIKKKDLASIFQIWLDAANVDRDILKQGDVASMLATALGERIAGPELLESMRTFIFDSANSKHDRSQLISVLGDAETKETVDILLRVATTLTDKELRQSALSGIGHLAGGGGRHEDLSPSLEHIWRESSDETLLVYLAKATAQVGASSGINLLLDYALAGKDDAQRRAAWGALVSVRMFNPNSVPPLAERLAIQPPGSPGSKLISDTLARMTTPAAAKALLNWLQNADESVAPVAHDYVVAATSPAQLVAWETALNPAVPFRSEKNRQAIREGLAKYRASYK